MHFHPLTFHVNRPAFVTPKKIFSVKLRQSVDSDYSDGSGVRSSLCEKDVALPFNFSCVVSGQVFGSSLPKVCELRIARVSLV